MLLPLRPSRAQGDIVACVVLHPKEQLSLTEIDRAVGALGPTVLRGRPLGASRLGA